MTDPVCQKELLEAICQHLKSTNPNCAVRVTEADTTYIAGSYCTLDGVRSGYWTIRIQDQSQIRLAFNRPHTHTFNSPGTVTVLFFPISDPDCLTRLADEILKLKNHTGD